MWLTHFLVSLAFIILVIRDSTCLIVDLKSVGMSLTSDMWVTLLECKR